MDQREENQDLDQAPEAGPGQGEPPDPKQLNAIERAYEHFRGVPLKWLDIFIGVCVAALVVVLVVGFLQARGKL